MKITKSNLEAKKLYKAWRIDPKVIPYKIWIQGLNVELEHGSQFKRSNITKDNLLMTSKIVMAHLFEFPDYYQRLEEMEKKADKYWEKRQKPSLFLPKERKTSRRTSRRKSRKSRKSKK